MMNNNAWLGCFPVDLCLLSCPSFVNLSLTMAAHIELYLFLSYLLYTLTPCHTLFFFFSEFDHYVLFTHADSRISSIRYLILIFLGTQFYHFITVDP